MKSIVDMFSCIAHSRMPDHVVIKNGITYGQVRGMLAKYEQRISVLRLQRAVNRSCSCGGMGPEDEGVCPACMVFHTLVTLKTGTSQ